VQYNDPAVNRRWWTRPHNGQATGAPDKSHCPAVALMTHALQRLQRGSAPCNLPKPPGARAAAMLRWYRSPEDTASIRPAT